jgi:protein-S-isoprenylcysteine O-methyltransferase Ste14
MHLNGGLLSIRLFARGSVMVALLVAALLLLAGRISYWQAWVFGVVNVGLVAGVSVALADQADLIRKRMKPAEGTKTWDRILMAVFFPVTTAVLMVAALDAGRFGWSGVIPLPLYPVFYVVYISGAYFHLWSIRSNPFYTSTVAVRPEAGHAVVGTGPYGIVRHPGYTGIIFMEAGIAVVLGSALALLPAGLVAVLLVVRTHLEDRALRRELPGYETYARSVRFKLLPHIW